MSGWGPGSCSGSCNTCKLVSRTSPRFLMNEMDDAFMFGRCAAMRYAASILRPTVCVQVMSPGTCPIHSNMGE